MAMKRQEGLRLLRQERDMSQEEAAKALGLTRPTYIQMERGAREPRLSELRKLCAIFSVHPDFFLKDDRSARERYQVVLKEERPVYKRKEQSFRISVPQAKIAVFKEVLLYILSKVGAKPNVGETVLYKLLYFIDFDYYEKYEEQLMGATYIKNHYGPTPMEFSGIVEKMLKDGEIGKVPSKYFRHEQKKYIPVRDPDLTVLDARQMKHIDDVLARLSDMNASQLSEYSHKDVPWIAAEDAKPLRYEAVFYRTVETSVRSYDEE